MKKPAWLSACWGGVTVLLILVSLTACAESSKTPDETVEVRLPGNSDALAAKSLTATPGSYSTADELYWTYTAVKDDSYFKTGQTSSETWLYTTTATDDEGNETTTVKSNLPDSLPGKFSVGEWIFTFNAYTSAEMSDEYLFYQGTATSVTLSSGGENTVSVTVELYEAVKDADEDGNTYGTLVVYGITIKDTSGENEISSLTGSDTTYAVVTLESNGETISEINDSGIAVMATEESDGLYLYYTTTDHDGEEVTSSDLPVGYYDVTVTFYIDGDKFATGTAENVLVRANLTTTVTGNTLEVTVEAELDDDVNVSYGSISVSSATELEAALADSEISTVVLTSSVSISEDTTIDISGHTLSSSSTAFTVESGASLTINGDEDSVLSSESSYIINVKQGASLTLNGGTYTTEGSSYVIRVADVSGSTDETTISLVGASVTSASSYTVYYGGSGTLNLSLSGSSTLANTSSSSAVYNKSGTVNIELEDTSSISSTSSAAIHNGTGTTNVTVKDSASIFASTSGKAIYNYSTGTTNVTIEDNGSVYSANGSAVYNNSTGSLSLTVSGSGKVAAYSSSVYAMTSAVYNNKGSLTVKVADSGSITAESSYAIYNGSSGTATITMTGGTISGGTYAVYNTGVLTVEISGGTISGTYSIVDGSSSTTVSVSITGGTVSGDLYSTNTSISLSPSESFTSYTVDDDSGTYYTYSATSA